MKIAILGAGPGGLYAALSAARKNIRVDLFEKRKVGEGIVCGECIFDSLNILPKPGKGLLRPVDEVVLQAHSPYTLPLSKHRPLWMLDRKTWQQSLAKLAQDRGVVVCELSKVTPGRLNRMQKEYDWILDASGAPSVASRLYSFTSDYFCEYLLAYQFVVEGDFGALTPRIKFAFFENLPARFQPAYYWVFPKDERTANVGVVCTAQGALKKGDPDLKKMLSDALSREGLQDAAILEKGGGVAPSGMLPRLVYGNILLVGDAAGLTSALHGGGIDLACLSGVLAVEAISHGPGGVAGYEKKLQAYLKERTALEDVAIRKMRSLSFDQFDGLLRGVTAKSKLARLQTGLKHPDMLWATLKWFKTKKSVPAWPV